jgi:Xaa-Pro dipeptidase
MLLGQTFELYNARATCWLDEERQRGYALDEDPIAVTRQLVLERGLGRARIGIEQSSWDLRGDTLLRIKAALPEARWVDAGGLIERVKRIKSPAEIACVRQAARLTDLGMQAALAATAAGRTDNTVAAAAYDAIIRNGGEYMCLDPIVTVGPRSGLPHSTHRRVPIQPGDAVLIEIGACYHRYSAPLMRTAFVAPLAAELRRAAEACRRANDTAIRGLRPGVPARAIAAEATRAWADVLPGRVWHGIYAYSIGLSFPPKWNDCPFGVTFDNEAPVEAGMVLHVTCSLRDPGRWGVAFSETVAVTEQGPEVLTNVTRDLVIR